MLNMALAGPYTSAASELSLRWVPLSMASVRAAGMDFVVSTKTAPQEFSPGGRDGGAI